DAGVAYALVDDRHFLAAGFEREQLHQPWHTESDGRGLDLFAIDERLRYLIPFRPPGEAVQYFRDLRERGHGLAILADDGEKFGGWPGTRELVYGRGWLLDFLGAMERMVAAGEMRLVSFQRALAEIPVGGLAYLPTASYREMEGWSLPDPAARRLQMLENELGEERLRGPDGALVRGSHWRNFLVKYPESNRMQKKASALSRLCRARGNPVEARRAIGRAQCNDAWWHGVFGGLYLPHLRHAIWRELARAESLLRHDESLEWEVVDADADGHDEILIHSSAFSATISPRRGGALEEYSVFGSGVNYADALTRRREAYHRVEEVTVPDDHAGTASIHEIQSAARLKELPPVDRHPRALFVDRITMPDGLDGSPGTVDPWWAGATVAREPVVEKDEEGTLALTLTTPVDAPVRVRKQYRFGPNGLLQVSVDWHADDAPESAVFALELSLGHPLGLTCSPGAEMVRYPITTVSMSERGFDHTVQGEA
ncbi:MAG: alpha-amylase/4-alpha-glucanotransferase domain-containing protein, partial [Gemmatimonadales bacterium]